MPTRRHRKTQTLAAKTAELAVAVPQIVAHRMTRLALAGPAPSARDRAEFHRMSAEKMAAFSRSWTAMALQTALASQALAASFVRSVWAPQPPAAGTAAAQWHEAALDVIDKGLDPVHRKAVANAKRLARTRLR